MVEARLVCRDQLCRRNLQRHTTVGLGKLLLKSCDHGRSDLTKVENLYMQRELSFPNLGHIKQLVNQVG